MKLAFLSTAAALGSLLLSNCAHEPVTQANASSASGSRIAGESRAALHDLYAQSPAARRLGHRSAGVLVFPKILKGAFVFGAEGGNGALFNSGEQVRGFYQTAGGSWGLQAGLEKSGYALFLLNPADVRHLNDANGWEVGSNPNLVIVDRGTAATLTTKTADKGVVAFVFNQKGLMGDLSVKGSKITRIQPGR